MSLLESTFGLIQERKERIESGKLNGIPFPLEQFRSEVPVIERGTYCIVSGQTKAAKSKLARKLFVFSPIMQSYEHPDLLNPHILYFPLEETPEEILLQFISYVVYLKSNKQIRLSTDTLKSSDTANLLSSELFNYIQSPEIKDILEYFIDHVEFCNDSNNVGIDIKIKSYLKAHGECVYEDFNYVDDITGETHQGKEMVRYVPHDPNEYVIAIVDHVSLLTPTAIDGSLMKAIATLSKNFVYLKNKFKIVGVLVQQQSAAETGGIEARKTGNIRATKAGLADCKNTGNDCTMMIGITNPYAFEFTSYLGYNLTKFKDSFRIMEIVLNRHGKSNGLCPLFFDGTVGEFVTLPAPNNDLELDKYYRYIDNRLSRKAPRKEFTLFSYAKNLFK